MFERDLSPTNSTRSSLTSKWPTAGHYLDVFQKLLDVLNGAVPSAPFQRSQYPHFYCYELQLNLRRSGPQWTAYVLRYLPVQGKAQNLGLPPPPDDMMGHTTMRPRRWLATTLRLPQ